MQRPPRSRDERLLHWPLLDNRIILWGIALEIALILAIVCTSTGQALCRVIHRCPLLLNFRNP